MFIIIDFSLNYLLYLLSLWRAWTKYSTIISAPRPSSHFGFWISKAPTIGFGYYTKQLSHGCKSWLIFFLTSSPHIHVAIEWYNTELRDPWLLSQHSPFAVEVTIAIHLEATASTTWFLVYHNLGVIPLSLRTTSIMIIVLKTKPNKKSKKRMTYGFLVRPESKWCLDIINK